MFCVWKGLTSNENGQGKGAFIFYLIDFEE